MKNLIAFLLVVAVTAGVKAQTSSPLPAKEILKEASLLAQKENKKVFVMFHASWCVWCRRMDASMNDASCKKYFDDHFIIRHLVVLESKEKKHLENPGAQELMDQYHGKGTGIPYWLIFDSSGNLLSDSKIRKDGESVEQGANVGCPATDEEVNYFIGVLRKHTTVREDILETVRKRFRENDK